MTRPSPFARVFLLTGLLALYVLPAQLKPRNFPSDDSLFYLQIAANIAAGHGSTFNTVTPTNGYHPLWMAPCVALAIVARGDRDLLLHLVFGLQALLALGCFLLFRAIARRLHIHSWPVGIPVLAAFFLTGVYGSEAHLNGLLVLASMHQLLDLVERPTRRRSILLGACLGLAVLARLDNAIFVAAVVMGVTVWLRSRGGPVFEVVSRVGAATLCVVLPYLGWNVLTFGHPMPISGAIKTTFPHTQWDPRNLGTLGLLSAVAGAVGLALALLPQARLALRLAMGTLAVGVLGQAIYVALFTDHNTHWSWYYVEGVLLGALLLAMVADSILRNRAPQAARRAVAVTITVLTVWGLTRDWARFANSQAASHNQLVFELLEPTSEERWEVQFARWMSRTLPPGSNVLVYDYPGALAYYSTVRIVAADGLVGDYQSNAELLSGGLAAFLSRHAIGYYLAPRATPSDSCFTESIYAPRPRREAGALVLCPENLLGTDEDVVSGAPAPPVALYAIGTALPPAGREPAPVVKHGTWW